MRKICNIVILRSLLRCCECWRPRSQSDCRYFGSYLIKCINDKWFINQIHGCKTFFRTNIRLLEDLHKKSDCRKIAIYSQWFYHNLNLNSNCRKINKTVCRTKVELSLMHAKLNISWFLCENLRIFDCKLIREIKRCLKFFHTVLKHLTKPLIWNLICYSLISRSEMVFIHAISRTKYQI